MKYSVSGNTAVAEPSNIMFVKKSLEDMIKKSFASPKINKQADKAKMVRLEVPITMPNSLNWLNQQNHPIKTYWSDREGSLEMAGIGIADIITSEEQAEYVQIFSKIEKTLSSSPGNLRYYGGLCFSSWPIRDQSWQGFGTLRFIIPRFEIITLGGQSFFACNFIIDADKAYNTQRDLLLQELEQITFDLWENPGILPDLNTREDVPDRSSWDQILKSVLASISQGKLKKIVLARKSILTFTEPLNSWVLLQHLKSVNFKSFHFCFQPAIGHAFIGSTPERLYHRQEREIEIEVLAGTRPRGLSTEADYKLGNELRLSAKELREHEFVLQDLKHSLTQLCSAIEMQEEYRLLKLAHIQHLFSRFQGKLMANVSDPQIISALHPTPSVGGYPIEPSLQEIKIQEPFDRGWYAGLVGWVGNKASEFAVAIRSGLIEKNKLSLFSGAGIVAGSTFQAEWEEIEHKINPFLRIFHIHD